MNESQWRAKSRFVVKLYESPIDNTSFHVDKQTKFANFALTHTLLSILCSSSFQT